MGMFDNVTKTAHTTPRDAKATGAARVRTLSPREEESVWRSEMLSELRRLADTSTQAAARGSSQIVNDVLEVSTRTFDGTGVMTFAYPATVGSIVITNPAVTQVTVQSGTQSGETAPTSGLGVQVVPAVSWLAVPIAAHAFTLYGTAGAKVSLQVFTGMTAFGITR